MTEVERINELVAVFNRHAGYDKYFYAEETNTLVDPNGGTGAETVRELIEWMEEQVRWWIERGDFRQ